MAPTFVDAALSLSIVLSSFAPSSAAHLQQRAVVVGTPPTPWTYAGCWTEGNGVRALSGASYTDGTAMTEAACITYCSTNGRNYAYSGTEYSSECFCGNALDTTAVAAPETDCNMGCSGNTAQACGAGNRLTVFRNPNVKPPVRSCNCIVSSFS